MRLALMMTAALLATAAQGQEVKSSLVGADPGALFIGDELWVDPTGRGDRLEAWASSDRHSFQRRGELLGLRDIKWVKADHAAVHYLWAPQMVQQGNRYLLYYAVGPQDPTPSRLGVATCVAPQGPCADSGAPLVTGGRGFEAIDPMVFVDPKSGKAYLYAGGSNGSTLRVFELKPDLVAIDHEVAVDQPPLFTEGAFMHERNGIYYLSYSHGHWNTSDYAVHYAMAATPVGPWKYRGVVLQSDRRYQGPGHHSFVHDPRDGSWLIVYHRWEWEKGNGPFTDERHVAVQPVSYDALGQIEPVKMSGH